ncbi:MAG: hypothetical protein ABIP74_03310 [Candidatus Saccharimonas sp.]
MDLSSTFLAIVAVIACWVVVLLVIYARQHKRMIRGTLRDLAPVAPKVSDDEVRLARIHEAETMPQRILEG